MKNHRTASDLEVTQAGNAIEYGHFPLFIENLMQQPVLVMPLERTLRHGSVTIFQWMIHITSRSDAQSPIAYATFWVAEVQQTALGQTLTFPTPSCWVEHPKERASHLQQQFLACITDLLKRSPQVSQVIVPARHRLPDEWVWSARCTDERLAYHNESWIIVEP